MKSFRLLHFTDTHLSGSPAATLRGVATLPALQAALTDARSRWPQAHGIVLTGDLVQDDPAGYQLVRQTFGASPVPVLCLAGNHDLPDEMRAALQGAPFQVGGAAEFGRWLVVLLDTWVPQAAHGQIGEQQLHWLEQTLLGHRNHHVLLCLHHHPLEMRSRWLDQVGLSDGPEFLELVRRHSNVRGVPWGHVHQSLDCFVHGVRFMASPATCAQFMPHSEEFALDGRPPGYRVLELMPDGSLATEVVWLERYAATGVA